MMERMCLYCKRVASGDVSMGKTTNKIILNWQITKREALFNHCVKTRRVDRILYLMLDSYSFQGDFLSYLN